MLSPYKLVPEIADHNALQSLRHDQMVATANALYNYYALLDLLKKGLSSENLAQVSPYIIDAGANEELVDSVHKAFVNCTMALEAAHLAEKKGG